MSISASLVEHWTYCHRTIDVLDISFLHQYLLGFYTQIFDCRFRYDLTSLQLLYLPIPLAFGYLFDLLIKVRRHAEGWTLSPTDRRELFPYLRVCELITGPRLLFEVREASGSELICSERCLFRVVNVESTMWSGDKQ